MHTILVPFNGTAFCARALPFATALARRGERIVLIRAVRAELLFADRQLARRVLLHRAEIEMVQVRDRIAAGGLRVEARVLEGDAGTAIVRAAEESGADLIVMATHRRTGLDRWLAGSVAEQVLRYTDTPVLMIPPSAPSGWPADRTPRIVVPLDGSDVSEAALGAARKLDDALGAEIVLVRAVEPPGYDYIDVPGLPGPVYGELPIEPLLDEARRYLEEIANGVGMRGRVRDVRVGIGRPVEVIAGVAAEVGADAIVMATHRRSGLARLRLGSVADAVAHHVAAPLLLVRAAGLRTAPEANTIRASADLIPLGRS